jgi:glycosyltransferase involved in cell wall biosynthesis
MAMVLASRIVGVHSIFMVVNNEALDYRPVHRWFDRPTDWLVRSSITNFITGSISSANKLINVLKLDSDKIFSFPNGVICRDPDESQETIRQRAGIDDMFSGLVGLVVSRFEYRKGHLVLLSALEILKKSGAISANNLRIIFEGNGPELQEVLDMIEHLDLSSIVQFVGDERNIANLYLASDFFVLPSIGGEDFSNVISESMSHGLCVIATDVAGAREQVSDGQTGFIVSPNNPIELSDVILRVVANPEVVSVAGQKGKDRYLNNFTPKIAVKRYFDLYKESIQN